MKSNKLDLDISDCVGPYMLEVLKESMNIS